MRSPFEVLLAFLRLGCLSFGGPVAHLAYFRDEFVRRRRWVDDDEFAQCVALTQLLPGPGSSQTGMLLGWIAAGPLGAFAAWVGFTLPSAAIMSGLALAIPHVTTNSGWLHALLLVATAVVASAIVTMRRSLAPDWQRLLFVFGVFAFVLAFPQPVIAPLSIALAAIAGALALYGRIPTTQAHLDLRIGRRAGIAALVLLALVFIALDVAASLTTAHLLVLSNLLFRVGSLVFGGGHVVLPLLQTQVASAGVVDAQAILAGYGAAQAMPGPLFTIASYVGAAAFNGELGVWGALFGTIAIFAPSFFLLPGVAPFYRQLATGERFRAALAGANAGVIGLLGAAFVTPIWSSAVRTPVDAGFVAVAFALLQYARLPSWALVLSGALAGSAIFR
jgi:chromate transporter